MDKIVWKKSNSPYGSACVYFTCKTCGRGFPAVPGFEEIAAEHDAKACCDVRRLEEIMETTTDRLEREYCVSRLAVIRGKSCWLRK